MPRSTLKLPPKPNQSNETGDSRPALRKPIRGGIKGAKQSVAQRSGTVTVSPERPEVRTEQEFKKEDTTRDRPRAPVRDVSPKQNERAGLKKASPSPRDVRVTEPPKVYPKRGIARSTGARALPPARTDSTQVVRQVEPERKTAEVNAVRRPLNEPPRLSKRISEMSQCSRREADEWIENGWVRVDGVVVTTLGTRVHPNAKIEIKEEASKHKTESVTILLNRLLDESGDLADEGDYAVRFIRPENRWAEDDSLLNFKATHLRGLAQAGKLDAESTGMLVFTQEGSVARRITGDDTRLEKEYMVRVEGELSPEGMKLLNHGLSLDEVKLKRAQVSWQNEQQLRFVLHESKKQQIQRMCELVGLRVKGIKRIRIGSVSLGKLPAGKWRYLRENERF